MSELLDLLLKSDLPDVQKKLPTARYRHKRLSAEAGAEVVFSLRALPYGRVQELKASGADMDLPLLLEGVTEPDFKDKRLLDKFGAVTPAEVVKALLLPGEIEELGRAVERLCGYRKTTIEELKNA